jgi:hypothetical protein
MQLQFQFITYDMQGNTFLRWGVSKKFNEFLFHLLQNYISPLRYKITLLKILIFFKTTNYGLPFSRLFSENKKVNLDKGRAFIVYFFYSFEVSNTNKRELFFLRKTTDGLNIKHFLYGYQLKIPGVRKAKTTQLHTEVTLILVSTTFNIATRNLCTLDFWHQYSADIKTF